MNFTKTNKDSILLQNCALEVSFLTIFWTKVHLQSTKQPIYLNH